LFAKDASSAFNPARQHHQEAAAKKMAELKRDFGGPSLTDPPKP
jgi:hypothetical protein